MELAIVSNLFKLFQNSIIASKLFKIIFEFDDMKLILSGYK